MSQANDDIILQVPRWKRSLGTADSAAHHADMQRHECNESYPWDIECEV